MRKQKRLRALGIEAYLSLIILRHFIAINAQDRSNAEDTMGDSIIGLP